MEYSLLKLIHLGSLIFWLGPALGAWLVFKNVESDGINQTTSKVNKAFFTMVTVEHIAFIALLLTGFLMATQYSLMETPWLQQKLIIITSIVIPLEIIDILLGNWLVAKASRKLYEEKTLSSAELRWIQIYHGPFTKLALLLIPLSVLLIMLLAIGKTTLL